MLSFQQIVATEFEAVNAFILEQLHSDVPLVENIGHHLIEAGGKRLRPLVVLLAAGALGYKNPLHHQLAAVVEFIHAATLLHDDVVDTSSMRRGRPTANAKWGNAPSVLVGDFLYSRAFQIMVSIGNIDVMRILSNTSNILSEGEVQQLVNAGDPAVTEASYFDVIYKKTAALFAAAGEAAGTLAEAPRVEIDALSRYGYHLGLAFQLIDDALDYQGDAEKMGKNLGDDLAEGKPTLPLILAMSTGTAEEKQCIANAIRNSDASQLQTIAAIVQRTGASDATLKRAQEQADLACQQLEHLMPSPYRNAMAELANFAVNRDH